MKTFAIAFAVFAVVAKLLLSPDSPKTFAFDKTFPENGSAWNFVVILDEGATALAVKEAELVDKMEMDPIFRCGNGLFGVRWQGVSLFSSVDAVLRRVYKLVLEDANPPNEDTIIVRHQVLGIKFPLDKRHDRFWCAGEKNEDGVCTKWDSAGYVAPKFTISLTDGATEDPNYKQKFELVPNSSNVPRTCPLTKSAFWCLWIFCPAL